MQRALAITGRPGSGKTTLALRVASHLRSLGCSVGGIITPEIRSASGVREGFYFESISDEAKVILATTRQSSDIRVGRYFVMPDAAHFARSVIMRDLENSDVIVIDEIGPMELSVEPLRSEIREVLLQRPKPLIVTFHYRLRQGWPDLYSLISRESLIIDLSRENREMEFARAPELARWLINGKACSAERGKGAHIHT